MKASFVSMNKEEEQTEKECRRCALVNPLTKTCINTKKSESKDRCSLFQEKQTSSKTSMAPELLVAAALHVSEKSRLRKSRWSKPNGRREHIFKVNCNSQGFKRTFSGLIEFKNDDGSKKSDLDKSILRILENIGLRDQKKKVNDADEWLPRTKSRDLNKTDV